MSVREELMAAAVRRMQLGAMPTAGVVASAAKGATMSRWERVKWLAQSVRTAWRLRALIAKSERPYVVFVTPWLTSPLQEGHYVDRVGEGLHPPNSVYVNYSKEQPMLTLDGHRVYNIGPLLDVLQRLRMPGALAMEAAIRGASTVQQFLLKAGNRGTAVTYCHYDANGLALALGARQRGWMLIEVQHGNVTGYAPYITAAEFPLLDQFIARDEPSAESVRSNVFSNWSTQVVVAPRIGLGVFTSDAPILIYASSVEIGGLHPVFLEFLQTEAANFFDIVIRPHPRERHLISHFEQALRSAKVRGRVSLNARWQDDAVSSRTIVMSPWSSIVEEAANESMLAMVIDAAGISRYALLLKSKVILSALTGEECEAVLLNYIAKPSGATESAV